jgi:hypothetical protein
LTPTGYASTLHAHHPTALARPSTALPELAV